MAAGCSSAESESGDLQSGEVNAANQGRSEPDATTSTLDLPIVAELPGNIESPYEIVTSDEVRIRGIDPYSHPTMPLEELARFLAAVETLDRGATCPPTVVPASLDGYAEVLRIAGGCMHIEYHPFEGRTIWQARYEIMEADPTVFAVGFPSDDLEPDQATDLDYDHYGQWHLDHLDVRELQAGWPSSEDDKIVVAVIDSGVDNRHPLLDNRIHISDELDTCHTRPHRTFRNAFKNNGKGKIHDHGTHVAGIIAANPLDEIINNALRAAWEHIAGIPANGMIGVAPSAQILPIKVHFRYDYHPVPLDKSGKPVKDDKGFSSVDRSKPDDKDCSDHVKTLSDALDIAFESEAHIVNMSLVWGTVDPPRDYLEEGLEW